jgi:hypothetical protein
MTAWPPPQKLRLFPSSSESDQSLDQFPEATSTVTPAARQKQRKYLANRRQSN